MTDPNVSRATEYLSRRLGEWREGNDAADDQAAENVLTGIVLGSGLGALADRIERPIAVDYQEIPGFAKATAGGHRGQLIFGRLAGGRVIAMAGRFHRYEGWNNDQVTFPVRVMGALGATRLIVSNAAGGVNSKFRVGDLMLIRDHLNWLHGGGPIPGTIPREPRRKPPANGCDENSAIRETPDRKQSVYDNGLSDLAVQAAIEGGFTLHQGTYLATLGPTYETRAEYRMMRRLGADAVGMSTVGEVLAAVALGMRVLGVSLISNVAQVDRAVKADHEEVLRAGRDAAAKMERLVTQLIGH